MKPFSKMLLILLVILFSNVIESFTQQEGLIPYRKGKLWGFCDEEKVIRVEPKFEDANPFSNSRAAVKFGGKWGFVDTKGKIVVNTKYEMVEPFYDDYAFVMSDGKWGIVDDDGKEVIPPKYDNVWCYSDDYTLIQMAGKWGLVVDGKEVILPRYDYFGQLYNGLAIVSINGKRGYINSEGKEVIPPIYDKIGPFVSDLAITEITGLKGVIDKSGKEIIPATFDDIIIINPDMIQVKKADKWGMYSDGIQIAPPKYDVILGIRNDVMPTFLAGKWGFLDDAGTQIIPDSLSNIWVAPSGLIFRKIDASMIFFNKKGQRLNRYTFDVPEQYPDGVKATQKDKLWGYVDDSGKEVIPPKYDSALDFCDEIARVTKDGREGYINLKGIEYWEEVQEAPEPQK